VRRSATLIAANRGARYARLNRKPAIAAIGDAGLLLQHLAQARPAAQPRWTEWIGRLRARDPKREAGIDLQAAVKAEHVNPVALFRALEREAGDDALFVADGGDFVATASHVLRPSSPHSWLDPAAFGGSGWARAWRSARRRRGRRARCGSSSATGPAASGWPGSIPSPAIACR